MSCASVLKIIFSGAWKLSIDVFRQLCRKKYSVCKTDGEDAKVPDVVYEITSKVVSHRELYRITWKQPIYADCVDGEMEAVTSDGLCMARAWFYMGNCYATVYYYTGSSAVTIANGSRAVGATIKSLCIEKLSHVMPSISDEWKMAADIPAVRNLTIPDNVSYCVLLTRMLAADCEDDLRETLKDETDDMLIEIKEIMCIERKQERLRTIDTDSSEKSVVKASTEIYIHKPRSNGEAGWTLVRAVQYDTYLNSKPRVENWTDYEHGVDGPSWHFKKTITAEPLITSTVDEDDTSSDEEDVDDDRECSSIPTDRQQQEQTPLIVVEG